MQGPPQSSPGTSGSERRIVLLVAIIQFVNILDFMMVMPLGPDFADALGIDMSQIGLVGGSYTAAAAVAGILGSVVLDRFDRRKALACAMIGLALGTAAGGFSVGLASLLASRVLAGAFGGPATSLSLAIVTDSVPPERRGKALGSVMAAFSVASVLGVPAGLELARRFGFRAPFFAVGLLGLSMALVGLKVMPAMASPLRHVGPSRWFPKVDKLMLLSLSNTTLTMLGVFAVVPNISAFVQNNMGYPRDRLGLLYLVGGLASFVTMRLVGILVDRFGAVPLVILGSVFHVVALQFAFIRPSVWMPILVIFTLYMLSGSVRMVPMQTLATRVPSPDQRARFMSAQSAVQHMASALGAFVGSLFLSAEPSGKLIGMDVIARGAMIAACLVPIGVLLLERGLRLRDGLVSPPLASELSR